jgi:hypothetical protein
MNASQPDRQHARVNHPAEHGTSSPHRFGRVVTGEDAFARFMSRVTVEDGVAQVSNTAPVPYLPQTSTPRLLGHDQFTRLPCLVDFRDVVERSVNGLVDRSVNRSVQTPSVLPTPAWVGKVPPRFAGCHHPALVQALWSRLDWLLKHPVSTEVGRDGQRRVQVMGCTVLEADTYGSLCGFAWVIGPDERSLLAPRDPSVHALWTMDRPLEWMRPFQLGLIDALMTSVLPDGFGRKQVRAYVNFLLAAWVKAHWSDEVHRNVAQAERDAVTSFLGWDPALVTQVQTMWSQVSEPMTLWRWATVKCCRAVDARLLAEAPQMVLLRCWLDDEVRPDQEHLRTLRTLLLAHGVRPAMWALLQRVGCEWMQAFMPYYRQGNQPGVAEVVDVLRLAQAFGTRELVDPALMHGLIALYANPNAPKSAFADRLEDLFGLASRLGVIWARASEDVREEMKAHVHAVFHWADRAWACVDPRSQRHIGWSGLLKLMRERQAEEQASLQSKSFGLSLSLTPRDPALVAVVLNSDRDVWEEGHRMHHCAYDYAKACAKGRGVMVSIRRSTDGKRLATALFRTQWRTPGCVEVSVGPVSGPANTLVDPVLRREISGLMAQVRRQLVAENEAESWRNRPVSLEKS